MSRSSPEGAFDFGENWRRFLKVVDEDRIREAERSLREMLGRATLSGLSFLDIGSGSGLFSLAAFRLGAKHIHSFDSDPSSVSCTQELRLRFASGASNWQVQQANVLDHRYMESIGQFDIVYAWGVLHHTGNMGVALANAGAAVAPAGRLFISIYNDQGFRSRIWRAVKALYGRLPSPLRPLYVVVVMAPRELMIALIATVRLNPRQYLRGWTDYKRERGMSRWHDLVDWVGGYPFEVASPESIVDFYTARGFRLQTLVRRRGLGCNQFVFERLPQPDERRFGGRLDREAGRASR